MPKGGQVGNMSDPDIVLYQLPRGPQAPNVSPFALKLETYLRMAKIPYKPVFGFKKSKKGKIPWITYNGRPVEDSSFIIEFLNKTLNVDLNKNLNAEQKAQTHVLQKMLEENTYWITVLMRWKYHNRVWLNKVCGIPKIAVWFIGRGLMKQTVSQGIGRHSYEEIVHILDQDLKALSSVLGNKKFIAGDQPCEADAAIFGQLSQVAYQGPDTPGMKMCKETYPNLWSYCERMRETFWPDWDECITHDGTTKPSK